ncbi:MAG: hypothetical protein FJW31_25620 [Acidobacteria bacterium]|nr:hypothetical protein [Acidobacteriota bacterium]
MKPGLLLKPIAPAKAEQDIQRPVNQMLLSPELRRPQVGGLTSPAPVQAPDMTFKRVFSH